MTLFATKDRCCPKYSQHNRTVFPPLRGRYGYPKVRKPESAEIVPLGKPRAETSLLYKATDSSRSVYMKMKYHSLYDPRFTRSFFAVLDSPRFGKLQPRIVVLAILIYFLPGHAYY